MKQVIFFSFILFYNCLSAQDILSTPFIVSGIVTIGGQGEVQFNINQETLCDSYSINSEVNYIGKIITFNVDYNYISNCGESFSIFTEFPSLQIKLSGVYLVMVNLNVATNPALNQQFVLGSIFVSSSDNTGCSNATIPFLEGFCPFYTDPVCACDGVDYNNECNAYLESGNGNYQFASCSQIINQKAFDFSCDTYSSFYGNFFEKYGCSGEDYAGDEIVIFYEHDPSDSLDINFTTSSNNACVFLIGLGNEGLSCYKKSIGNLLSLEGVPAGWYYLVVDRISPGPFSIEFCTSTSIETEITSSLKVYPNPASNHINISGLDSGVKKLDIFNLYGELVKSLKIDHNEMRIDASELNGVFMLNVIYFNGKNEVFPIIVNN